ncbi:MAG: histidinol-phosphate transaminase [Desulfotomaculaceae bacterium]|nr:histidinol-phosphate transaminase [Desulfotomaculaceae bacterium]
MTTIFNAASLVREELKGLLPYHAPYYPSVLKLDANENPYPFPKEVMEKIYRETASSGFNRYPDPMAVQLRESLAAYTGVSPENIMLGNGSDELILDLMLTFGTGAKFVVASPSFVMYGIQGQIASSTRLDVPRLSDFHLDVAEMQKAAAEPGVKLVVICTPNNPTGTATPRCEIEAILGNTSALVVVDEAYGEFGGESCVPLLESYPNLIILKTFSKAFGLAGLRVGYLLAGASIINELLRVKQPFNLNAFSQIAARVVMENLAPFRERVGTILKERDRLFAELSAVQGVETFPTEANFILFRTALPAAQVYQGLLERGVLVRSVDSPSLSRCLRVSVGTSEENTTFLASMREILA